MLSKTKITSLRLLHDATYRKNTRRFLVEGKKSIQEVVQSDLRIVEGFFINNFLAPLAIDFPVELISLQELSRISSLSSNRDGVVVVEMPQMSYTHREEGVVLILDGINDPGNLGTILRIADWYGVSEIIASEHTVDVYNPKTIIASMGSFTRVSVSYQNIVQFFENIPKTDTRKIYGACMNGTNLHTMHFHKNSAYIVIGSESHGISSQISSYITNAITIPRFGKAESLNAAIATAVILDHIRAKGET